MLLLSVHDLSPNAERSYSAQAGDPTAIAGQIGQQMETESSRHWHWVVVALLALCIAGYTWALL
jgi:hypothetical protein